ncbi:MAG: type 1 glutamine amidotransferase, partial [bacterium]
ASQTVIIRSNDHKGALIYIIKQVPHEGPGIFGELLQENGLDYRTLEMYQSSHIDWPSPDQVDGLLVMGGPMGVYETDRYPFLLEEERLIGQLIRRDKPVLGICLGAQLIAKAAGAKVYSGVGKEIGWYPVKLTPEGKKDALFSRLPEETTVFQWHGDTFSLPDGGGQLASSALFENQAFRLENRVYALQFHLEVTEEIIKEWLEINRTEVLEAGIDPETVMADTRKHVKELNRLGKNLFRRFCLGACRT